MSAVETRRAATAMDLAVLRYEHGFTEPDVRKVKAFATSCVDDASADAHPRLAGLLRDGVSEADVEAALKVDLFSGLATPEQEMAHASKSVPMLTQRVVKISGKHSVCSHRLADMFIRKLQHDKAFRTRCQAKSNEWKTGRYWNQMPTETIGDMDEAVRMRFHPHAMRPATEAELHDLRMIWIFGGDDIGASHPASHSLVRLPH